jgi:hypothetical protein
MTGSLRGQIGEVGRGELVGQAENVFSGGSASMQKDDGAAGRREGGATVQDGLIAVRVWRWNR